MAQIALAPARSRATPRRRGLRLAVTTTVVFLGSLLCAAALPRDVLWGVESACILNARTTGAAFPCVEVHLERGLDEGYAVLRAPMRRSHLVVMPTARVLGVESSRLRGPDAPNYFADAWDARRLLPEEPRPLQWNDAGLAVNSRVTRSQDQLHIHVDCVRPRVKALVAERLAATPADRWLDRGLVFQGQAYWTRRVESPSLAGVNPFRLAADLPGFADKPSLSIFAVIGTTDAGGRDGFMLLAGQSDPAQAARQSTSEDLLDHSCRILR